MYVTFICRLKRYIYILRHLKITKNKKKYKSYWEPLKVEKKGKPIITDVYFKTIHDNDIRCLFKVGILINTFISL